MRIVSQDRTISVNFDDVVIKEYSEFIYVALNGENKVLGKYKTEERAQDIFNDIHYEWEKEVTKHPYSKVYWMPEE